MQINTNESFIYNRLIQKKQIAKMAIFMSETVNTKLILEKMNSQLALFFFWIINEKIYLSVFISFKILIMFLGFIEVYTWKPSRLQNTENCIEDDSVFFEWYQCECHWEYVPCKCFSFIYNLLISFYNLFMYENMLSYSNLH